MENLLDRLHTAADGASSAWDDAPEQFRPVLAVASNYMTEAADAIMGLKAVCVRLLTQRIEIGYGYDEASGEKGYFVGTHFCGPERDAIVEYLLNRELRH